MPASPGQENSEAKSSSPLLSLARPYEPETPTVGTATRPRPHSRILSGPQLSPLKILQDRAQRTEDASGSTSGTDEQSPKNAGVTPSLRSARKIFSPERRFPIKVNANAPATPSPVEEMPRAESEPAVVEEVRKEVGTPEREMTLAEAIKDNAGLKHAIEIFEDDIDIHASADEDDNLTATNGALAAQLRAHQLAATNDAEDEPAMADDTMISTFSTFSAVPNLTMFAKLGTSPPKTASLSPNRTPRAAPLPDRGGQMRDNTTSLLDFTEQLRFQNQQSPGKRGRMSPTKGDFATPQVTRQRNAMNLLDFDIPPLPTPRSIPTITPRELESLKSAFLSEISSLKASLSGKEAEAHSLKAAVGDAEKRVGECMEQLREEKGMRESLAAERDVLDRRGREMEGVLRQVKGEIVHLQREREELDAKLNEAEARREAAEMMAQDAESKMAGMRAGKASAESAAASGASAEKSRSPGGAVNSNKEVEIAVERVARELHALYKGKHETKVAALKKSYENRWEKRVRELEGKIEELTRDNDELRIGRDATMTRVDPARLAQEEEERKEQAAKDAAQISELHAEVEKLEATMSSVKADNSELRVLLEAERVEKGELVQLAEELMSMQQSFIASAAEEEGPAAAGRALAGAGTARSARVPQQTSATGTPLTAASGRPKRRSSTSGRVSGLKPPGSGLPGPAGESRTGRVAMHERPKSMAIGSAQRSGIMSSIEKMGSYRGRGGE
jgi:hypothetical protein